ncbi:neutral zinc metallopeptidase [Pseudonocardia humida]|uniref:Neutral zinc metallopeptidase n=1 Tax=Pseudonocardia humida TaxID=2800819 RepID=A0ABT1A6N3_9PSEU|nr:neutral zinc metallopeptidase [Pseudonocardia humida]MCO1658678.1 neutral zinc metallopeptidase [Pseudonocardia humida]
MSGPRFARQLIPVLAAALLLVGCTVRIGSSPGSGAGTGAGTPSSGGAASETRQQDEQDAIDVVDAFWQRHFAELSRAPYDPPRVAGGYVGEDGPPCGGTPSPPGNAFYCPAGDFLAWDEQLMEAGYRQIGDAWVYVVIAHEWGHAVQARLRATQVSVAAELQADCMAGATLQGAVDDGLVRLEPGDTDELATALVAVADEYPWADPSSHGDARERTDAFSAGASGGLRACV